MRERLEKRRRELSRKMRNRKLFWSFIICTLIIVGSLAHLGFNSDFTRIKEEVAETVTPEKILPTLQKPTTIMLMGVDERKDDVGRSDTLMVVQLSKDKASLLTIPRDTLVYVDRHGYQKVNAAYAYGGAKLARKTVEEFLGIDIDRYVMINKARFAEVIDAMGGVDIYVERDMHYEDPWDDDGLYIDIKQGIRHLDGQTAIEFVRFRDEEGDVGRVRRQQAFMKACANRLSEPSMLIKIPELLSVAVDAVDTDLTSTEMLAAAGSLKNAESAGNIKTGVVPGWLQYIDDISYLIPNAERLGNVMIKHLEFDDANKKHFDKLATEYVPGSDMEYYDVNPNPEKDLRVLDSLHSYTLELSENKL